jgi:hypothetical protein
VVRPVSNLVSIGGFRSRLVADASGAPVLRDQGPIGRIRVLACTAVTSANGANMLRAKIAHRARDERPGFGGRRLGLRPHQSLDNPTEA